MNQESAPLLFEARRLLVYVEDADGVTETVALPDGTAKNIRARYLLCCKGGRSITLKSMGVTFECQS